MKAIIDPIQQINDLYQKQFGKTPSRIDKLPVSGSPRRYFRVFDEDGNSNIAAYNGNIKENNSFFYFSHLFRNQGLNVPEVLIHNSKGIYLQNDLGAESLYDVIKKEGHSDRVKDLLKKSIDALVRFHWQAGPAVDYSFCFASPKFDARQILSDLLYFKYYFVDPLELDYDKIGLLAEMKSWSDELGNIRPTTFMYRDFQSRNIIVKEDKVGFIDYQGGMLGLPSYDLASLLWQSRAQFSDQWKNELLNYYFEALSNLKEKPDVDETEFKKVYLQCVLIRMMQTLGAYGFRGLIQQKDLFKVAIPGALSQLRGFLEQYPQYPMYPELQSLLKKLTGKNVIQRFQPKTFLESNINKLQVHVYSFSYKKGLPVDESGHGGGFVFDCRGIFNPGRQNEYKELTGRDEPVGDFLTNQTKMPAFLEGVYRTVDISVENYLERGFEALSVAFGCTGGQHRSVFAAESFCHHLEEKYGLKPILIHLEQEENDVKRCSK